MKKAASVQDQNQELSARDLMWAQSLILHSDIQNKGIKLLGCARERK
jgi:hypothetical protein